MSPTIGLPPPDPEICLVTSRESRFKGGTLIDEDVGDLEAHERRVCDPDRYRPVRCPRCGHDVLHVHCYPERHPRGELGMPPVVRIVQYICAAAECGATWRILPMFLARHLWRAWKTVERVVGPDDTAAQPAAPPVPERTRCRWRSRLAATARTLVVLLAASGGLALETLAARVGLDATRAEFVQTHTAVATVRPGARLASVAALVHRLERGMRLM
jgi:hypothetical protein